MDNASTDRSAEIARAHGARVVAEPRRGYGSAYLRGFAEATGEHVVMLDADGTYPAEKIGDFVALLEQGADFVMGNRFAGLMEKGAMPFMNRYVGNPVLSGLTRMLFRVRVQDIHCGMRAFRRSKLPELALQTPGMEFATEMVVKALDAGLAVRQVPIPYRPRIGESKLNPFRDAWRHVEYMLVFSPAVTFLWPGFALLALGLLIQVALLSGPTHLFRTWDVHTSLGGLTATLAGTLLVVLGVISASYAGKIGMRFRHSPLARAVSLMGDAPVRVVGALLAVVGGGTWLAVAWQWAASGFGALAAVPQLAFASSLLVAGLALLSAAFIVHAIRLSP